MSLSTMTSLAFAQQQITGVAPSTPGGSGAADVRSAMEKLVAFIPSEVVGIYVAGFGIIGPTTASGRWAIFVVACLLVPAFILINQAFKKQQAGANARSMSTGRAVGLIAFGLLAFAAWAMALPETPFLDITDRANAIGGFAVLILAAIMYPLASVLRLT